MEVKNIQELKELIGLCIKEAIINRNKDMNLAWLYAGQNDKLRAIRYYRDATGVSLVEAKTYMDKVWKIYNIGKEPK